MRRLVCPIAALTLVACSGDNNPLFNSGSLHVSNVSVNLNPYNVLSLNFSFDATGGDSARILYTSPTDSGSTPWSRLVSGANHMTVLGLLPQQEYQLTLQVVGANGETVTPKYLQFSGALPPFVADAKITYTGTPGPGFTLLSPIEETTQSTAAIAFDSLGRVRWYREFPNWHMVDAQMQRNGHYTIGLASPQLELQFLEEGPFIEVLPNGDSVTTYSAPAGYQTDAHEVVLTGDSASGVVAQFFAYDTARNVNLTPIGGPSSAEIYGHHVFRMIGNSVAFSWDAWSTYGITDWIEPSNFTGDFDHPNAISLDADSNYIISFRNMGCVVKMNRTTGAIIWQLGGVRSTFKILNDPLGFFSAQHFARRLPNGHILLYDDGVRHSPPETRAVEYALDTVANTATMVWEYVPQPAVFTEVVGSAQRLANGNTVVGFGYVSQIDEVDPNGHLLARGFFTWSGAKAFYRSLRMPSLYQYETP
jgi:hypothetical protein